MDRQFWCEILLEEPLRHHIVVAVVIEAHSVYKWSKDFRHAYSQLWAVVPNGVPMMALTETITKLMLAIVKI